MKTKIVIMITIFVFWAILANLANSEIQKPQDTFTGKVYPEPNQPRSLQPVNNIGQVPGEPRKIVMPKNVPLYKCPIHGMVDKSVLTIEIDGKIYIYCKRCAMQLVVDLLDGNIPELEVIKQKIEVLEPNE